jgi:hypothetical protein
MELQKLRPVQPGLTTCGGGFQVVPTEDVPYGDRIDGVRKIPQRALDAPIAPGRMLLGHLDRKPLDLLRYSWPTTQCAGLAPIDLLRDEVGIPAQKRRGGRKRRNLLEACTTERVRQCGEPATFYVGEPQPPMAELGVEHAIFLTPIGDHLLLVTLHPASNHADEHLQEHGLSSSWKL